MLMPAQIEKLEDLKLFTFMDKTTTAIDVAARENAVIRFEEKKS